MVFSGCISSGGIVGSYVSFIPSLSPRGHKESGMTEQQQILFIIVAVSIYILSNMAILTSARWYFIVVWLEILY